LTLLSKTATLKLDGKDGSKAIGWETGKVGIWRTTTRHIPYPPTPIQYHNQLTY